MDPNAVLLVTNALLIFLVGLLAAAYLPAYAKSKAKNLATKEDVGEITENVEKVRAAISNETALRRKRREVYERIADSLRIFIDGHKASDLQKEAFQSAYAACWLWAPDTLILALNQFIEVQKDLAVDSSSHPQEQIKSLYSQVMIEMRKDVGFSSTELTDQAYQFVTFQQTTPRNAPQPRA